MPLTSSVISHVWLQSAIRSAYLRLYLLCTSKQYYCLALRPVSDCWYIYISSGRKSVFMMSRKITSHSFPLWIRSYAIYKAFMSAFLLFVSSYPTTVSVVASHRMADSFFYQPPSYPSPPEWIHHVAIYFPLSQGYFVSWLKMFFSLHTTNNLSIRLVPSVASL